MSTVSRQRAAAGLGLIVLAVAAILFPAVFSSPVLTNYAIYALIFVAVVSAWNLFSGFSGYISLGQAVFFGSGAYAVGIAARDWHINGVGVFALLPLAAAVGAVIAVPFGLVALRVRRHTFIVITIAVFFIFQLAAANFSFTGGSVGVAAPFLPWSPTEFNDRFYYITLACAVAAIIIAAVVRRARFGLQLRAIRDDEDRARGLGVRTMRVKLSAFVISATITGLVGGVWFLYLTQVEPPSGYDPLFDLSLVLMAFLGGLGTISGPVIGALIIEPEGAIHEFAEKPPMERAYVNGGYMVCDHRVFNHLSDDPSLMFEREPIANMLRKGQLHSYRHEGFWQPMDTLRDKQRLEELWASGKAPWKTW